MFYQCFKGVLAVFFVYRIAQVTP